MPDVIVVGGGPAGLGAAVVLARACRSVLVIDAGRPRNRASRAMHNYLTRDGIAPRRFLELARRELRTFGGSILRGEVVRAAREKVGFSLTLADGRRVRSHTLLLATGVVDELPGLPGLRSMYGRSVHHCPYCDGWSWRGRRLAALGPGRKAAGLALALRGWSDDVVALTGGEGRLSAAVRRTLEAHGVAAREEPIVRLQGSAGMLRRIVFASGPPLVRDALFFNTHQAQSSPLPKQLGCELDGRGAVKVDRRERSCVPGVWVVGDATPNVQFVVNAAAEGASAAVAINKAFQVRAGRVLASRA